MKKKFPFEDFTLIMTRNCNLQCEYCPLDHFKGNISNEVLDIFFENILKYHDYDFYITLFGGEPLLNKEGIEYISFLFNKNKSKFLVNNSLITLKVVTNGTLLTDSYIKVFKAIDSLEFVNLVINISIDGSKETQLRQRKYKGSDVDYYEKMQNNIHSLINSNINIEFGMVLSFFNNKYLNDIIYLIKEFNIPIFIMPVDLTLDYIKGNINIYKNVKTYLINIGKTLKLIENNNLLGYIVNYNNDFRDLKIPPIGPTIDINGDIYTTRDFLFTMDKSIKFKSIGNIFKDNMIKYFFENEKKIIEQETLKAYYGKTFSINKKVGDYFTNLIYKK